MSPSLLSCVRASLDDVPVVQPGLIPSWRAAVVAAGAILALTMSYVLRRPITQSDSQQHPSIVAQSTEHPQAAGPGAHLQAPEVARTSAPTYVSASPPVKRASTATPPSTPEVIVLPEERQAFAVFVAEIPEQKAGALALTGPAPPPLDQPLEIALLHIDDLQLKPLDGTENQEQPKSTR